MTRIKFCGLSRPEDITAVNALLPAYIGFVFYKKSRRYIPPETAACLKKQLDPGIRAVGVFVNEAPEQVASLLRQGVIDIAQLHGDEDEAYLKRLRALTEKPLWKAFRFDRIQDPEQLIHSSADLILLDAGAGDGTPFDWTKITKIRRPYMLAGGLAPENIQKAIALLHPFGVDVSSGIETDGVKDVEKMAAFSAAVRKEDKA